MTDTGKTPYARIGGESRVRELVERFYDHMDASEDAQLIRNLHARSLKVAREKLFLFLSGWLGGPDLYVQKYGHPRLRRRHLPFSIGQLERDQWMHCMRSAIADMQMDPALAAWLEQAFFATADHMRNRPEHQEDARLPVASASPPGTTG